MSKIARIASGISLTLLVSGSVLYVVIAGIQAVPKSIQPVQAAQDSSTLPEQGMSSWLISRIPLLPWSPHQEQLVAVMVENHQSARPHHAGLDKALFIQEFFAEGYISRFVALFRLDDLPEEIGPVRSLRPYFIQAFLPWTPFVFHAGGSPEALDRVQDFDDVQNYNAIYLEEAFFDRKAGVPAPHDLFITSQDIRDLLKDDREKYARTTAVPIYKTGRAAAGSGAAVIDINFYSAAHNIRYVYNEKKRSYQRINGNVISPATPKNVVVVEMDVKEIGPLGRLAINSLGSGEALFFRSGKVYKGTWQRSKETEPYRFTDQNGVPIVFAAGQIWLTSINDLGRVKWQ